MDVERIQKINKLALDLMKQGLASDRDDAVVQAEKIFKSNDGDNQSIRQRMQATEPQMSVTSSASQVDLHPDKVKDILQQNSQFLVKKITEFQEQMLSMKKELDDLRQKVSRHSAPVAAAASTEAPKLGEVFTHNHEPKPQPPPQSSTSHPRSGNYKTEEVSIEKFFYMGNKR